jgi:Zn-dependent protease with chaperone function
MRKAIVIVVLVVLAAPLFGLLASAVVASRLTPIFPQDAITALCDANGAPLIGGAGASCSKQQRNALLWTASASVFALTIFLPAVYAALTYAISRRAEWLAACFPWVVRLAMVGLAILLVLHGVLILYAGFVVGDLFGFLLVLSLGLGFAWLALLILSEALSLWMIQPLSIVGIVLTPEQLPGLTARVAQLAKRLNARVPDRIVVGLEPRAFVTSLPLNLRGQGLLPAAETLYLSTYCLRAFDEPQLDALIGHELAHFRAGDLAFTTRFAPSFRALGAAIASVSWEEKPAETPRFWWLARLPAGVLLAGMAIVVVSSVNRIRRAREFDADAVGASVSSNAAFAAALVKVTLLTLLWRPFRTENAKYVGSGRARINLSIDYLSHLARGIAKADRVKLRDVLFKTRLAHPIDTHPILAERVRVLQVEPLALFDRSVEELMREGPAADGLEALEEAITARENDWLSIPGTPYVLDARVEPPRPPRTSAP